MSPHCGVGAKTFLEGLLVFTVFVPMYVLVRMCLGLLIKCVVCEHWHAQAGPDRGPFLLPEPPRLVQLNFQRLHFGSDHASAPLEEK